MNPASNYNSTNPFIEDSFVGSPYLNPDYWFDHMVRVAGSIFTGDSLRDLYTALTLFSIFFIAVIIYSAIRVFEIRKKEHMHLHHEIHEYGHKQALREKELEEKGAYKNEQWKSVLNLLFSNNRNDWKLAVIEADLMLFDLLTQLGFKGETVGDKLKDATRDDFRSLTSAWEAHTVRNRIAHEGTYFELSLHEAKRVVSLYQQIFEEFGYI